MIDDINSIFNHFNKTTRYEIKKAKSFGLLTSIVQSEKIDNLFIDSLANEYLNFLNEKRLPIVDKNEFINTISNYNSNDNMIITIGLMNSKPMSWHVYIHDKKTARLLLSFSHFRDADDQPKNIFSILNRMQHFDDIVFFKENNFLVYDWGGIGFEDDLKTITQFKMGFGGVQKHYYYCIKGNTLFGKIAALFKKR